MKPAHWIFGLLASAAISTVALADDRVVILPFNSLNVPDNQQWIGKGVQENLAADLGRNGLVPVPYNAQVIVEDNAGAVRVARTLNAPYVVRGSVQSVGNDLRLTAQLIDTRTGDTIRTALVTGTPDGLLKLEDQLAAQIRGVPEATPAAAPAAAASAYTPIIIPQAQPQIIVVSPPSPTYYPAYSYPYYNAFYPRNSIFYPIILHPVHNGHDHDHDPNCGPDGNHHQGPGVQVVHHDFDPASLPIPTGNVLPIPTGNVLPIPTNNVLPVPTNNVQPLPVRNVQPLANNSVSPLPTRTTSPLPVSGTIPVISHNAPPAPVAQRSSAPRSVAPVANPTSSRKMQGN